MLISYRAAELLTSLAPSDLDPGSDTDPDSPMDNAEPLPPALPIVVTANPNLIERRLESQELHKYLLAKSYFDCREYDRCAAVFLPSNLSRGPMSTESPSKIHTPSTPKKGKAKASSSTPGHPRSTFPRMSQKALFLALYAKYMSGEKRKDEDSEMILGPLDGGATINKELVGLGRGLEGWFAKRRKDGGQEEYGQGWLEYLYGIVLAKGKNDEEARRWLIRSVHLYPYNWGAWLELSELLGSVEEVRQSQPVTKDHHNAKTCTVESYHTGIATKYNDPYFPPLYKPRAIPINRSDTWPVDRTRKHISQQSIFKDSTSASFLPLQRYYSMTSPKYPIAE